MNKVQLGAGAGASAGAVQAEFAGERCWTVPIPLQRHLRTCMDTDETAATDSRHRHLVSSFQEHLNGADTSDRPARPASITVVVTGFFLSGFPIASWSRFSLFVSPTSSKPEADSHLTSVFCRFGAQAQRLHHCRSYGNTPDASGLLVMYLAISIDAPGICSCINYKGPVAGGTLIEVPGRGLQQPCRYAVFARLVIHRDS
ncbi:hypothetical protein LZ30DRAFT_694993 [Colletotrichum cereale]|nr:hypothetical protein LZ30DRAFT_694993 [Colletotrichum cereale]